MNKADKQWALYKGDEFITSGTIRQIARDTGKSFDWLYFMTTPAYKRRGGSKRPRLEMVELEDDDS